MAQGKTLENVLSKDTLSGSVMCNIPGQREDNAFFCDRCMLGEVPVWNLLKSRYKSNHRFPSERRDPRMDRCITTSHQGFEAKVFCDDSARWLRRRILERIGRRPCRR